MFKDLKSDQKNGMEVWVKSIKSIKFVTSCYVRLGWSEVINLL